jgi:lipopolysaccharide export system protein LptA
LASAGFLLLVICSFIGGAHYLRHHRVTLPTRLGVNIVQETDGFAYSQWDDAKHKTVFTIHAAKALSYTDGKITLHDVAMTLYGEKQDRNDRIKGDEFEYDQKAGVFRSVGVVHIDLQGAQPVGGKVVSSDAAAAKVMHVTTSGLVYIQSLGVAATSEPLDFQAGAMTGHAIGADYSRDSGVLLLHSAVSMSGMAGRRPLAVTAATAEIDNHNRQIFLTGARCVSLGQTVEAQRATLHTRPDGTLAQVEAAGNVTTEANGARVVSQRENVVLNAKSQPESAVLTGGVQYSSERPLQQRKGQADAATIAFDAQGQARHAEFMGAVHLVEQTRATEAAQEPWSLRELTAAKVEAVLLPVATDSDAGSGVGRSQLRDAEAMGSARLVMVDNGSLASTRGMGRTEISADDLKAHLICARNGRQSPRLDTVAGRGSTLLHQVKADGIDETSSGDSLDAKFRASAAASKTFGGEGVDDLLSAVQQGHVTMTRRAPAKAGKGQEDFEQATAQRAVYDGDLDLVTLTGAVQVSDRTSALWADRVAMHRTSGDALATGSVKGNYLREETAAQASEMHGTAPGRASQPSGAGEPTHVLADRAEMVHATGVATFYGKPVRLWQGGSGSQVQAPVIELEHEQQLLTARGTAAGGQVHTILVSEAKSGVGKAGAESKTPGVMRVASGEMVYLGELRQAEFSGGVRAETVDGTIRAREATVYLQKAAGTNGTAGQAAIPSTGTAVPSLAGSVERMVATRQIEIEQPGRRATGERLVYTASDQLFVLTGDGKAQPRLVDAAQGTITGEVLKFHTGDDSVVVSNAEPGAAGPPEQTETRAGKGATIGRGK